MNHPQRNSRNTNQADDATSLKEKPIQRKHNIFINDFFLKKKKKIAIPSSTSEKSNRIQLLKFIRNTITD